MVPPQGGNHGHMVLRSGARPGAAASDSEESVSNPQPTDQRGIADLGEQLSLLLEGMRSLQHSVQELHGRVEVMENGTQEPMAAGDAFGDQEVRVSPVRETINPIFSPEVPPNSGDSSAATHRGSNAPCSIAQKEQNRLKKLNLDSVAHTREDRLSSLIIWKREVDATAGVLEEAHQDYQTTSNAAWILLLKNNINCHSVLSLLETTPACMKWSEIVVRLMEEAAGPRYQLVIWQLWLKLTQAPNDSFERFLSYFTYLANMCVTYAPDHHIAPETDIISVSWLSSKLNPLGASIATAFLSRYPNEYGNYQRFLAFFKEQELDIKEKERLRELEVFQARAVHQGRPRDGGIVPAQGPSSGSQDNHQGKGNRKDGNKNVRPAHNNRNPQRNAAGPGKPKVDANPAPNDSASLN